MRAFFSSYIESLLDILGSLRRGARRARVVYGAALFFKTVFFRFKIAGFIFKYLKKHLKLGRVLGTKIVGYNFIETTQYLGC
jgi:hypothetical protein